jgi:hypothetical protein
LPPAVAAYDALKHQVPTAVGICGVGKVNVELFPLGVDVPVEPTLEPPVHAVGGALSSHKVQLTAPVGAPPAALPATVAVSPQGLPTALAAGATTVVVNPGVAGVTLKHSVLSTELSKLSLEPW